MLTLTSNAALVIRSLTDGSELPAGSGLRISSQPEDDQSLELVMAAEPVTQDTVVENEGARVFLEDTAATMLETMVLDAEVDDEGGVQFFLGQQPGEDDAVEQPSPS